MEDRVYTCIQTMIGVGDIDDAQKMLDDEEKDARWHYIQSQIYFAKKWYNESRKQLEIVVELDPGNEQYKEELESLKNVAENENGDDKAEMGKRKFRDKCCECCSLCCQVCADSAIGC